MAECVNNKGKLVGGTLTPTPWSGDYKTAEEMKQAILSGKDVVINTPSMETYCSIRDMEPGAKLQIRFNQHRDVDVFEVPNYTQD